MKLPRLGLTVSDKDGRKFVHELILEAVRLRASDIHLEPYQDFFRVRFRIHGDLYEVFDERIKFYPLIASRIKILAGMDIAQKRLPQDGRFSYELDDRMLDIRISVVPAIDGEKVALRLLNTDAFLLSLDALGLEEADKDRLHRFFTSKGGLFLLSGVTGSGKTTTLYSLLETMKKRNEHIITIEDPVEYRISGITQVNVNRKAGLDFDNALRSFLRQDPDIILVGEIRDEQTAALAIRAALTGHLVMGTIHTRNALASITRLRDLGIEDYLLSASLLGVASQRLIKTLCPHCKSKRKMTEREQSLVRGILGDINETDTYTPVGCSRCVEGYIGRQGVFEVIPLDRMMSSYIAEHKTEEEIQKLAADKGYCSMLENACIAMLRGETDLKEVMRKVYE